MKKITKKKKIILITSAALLVAAAVIISVFVGINYGDQPEFSYEAQSEARDAADITFTDSRTETDDHGIYVIESNEIRFTTEVDTYVAEEEGVKYYHYCPTVEYLKKPEEIFSDIISIGQSDDLYTGENGAPFVELKLNYTRVSDGANITVSYSAENTLMYYLYDNKGIAFRFPLPQEDFADLTVTMSTAYTRPANSASELWVTVQFIHQNNGGVFEWNKLCTLFSASPFIHYRVSPLVNDPGFDIAMSGLIPFFWD